MKNLFRQFITSGTIKDSFVVAVGLGGSAVIGFIYTILLARSLGPDKFGVYSALTALAAIVYSLGDMGISSAIVNFLPKNKSPRYHLISTSFWLQFFVGVIIITLFVTASFFHNYIVPGSLSSDLILGGALAFNYLLIVYTQGVFTAERKFWSYTTSQLIDSAVKIVIVFFLFRAGNLSVGTAIGANVFSTLIAILITFGKELFRIEFDFFKDTFNDIFHFAKWIALSRVFTVMISRIDIVLLNLLAGSFAAGVFSAASRVTIFFAMMAAGLNSVINPRFSSFDSTEKVSSYIRKLALLVTSVAIGMIGISFLAGPIINIVYGPKYLDSIPVFRYLILAMVPFLYTIISNSALIYSFNKLNYFTGMMIIQTTTIIILDLLLIPKLGHQAPAISLFASNIFVLFASYWMVGKLIKQKHLEHASGKQVVFENTP